MHPCRSRDYTCLMKHEARAMEHYSNPFRITIAIDGWFPHLDGFHEALTGPIIELASDSEIMKVVCALEVSRRRAQALHILRTCSPSAFTSQVVCRSAVRRRTSPKRMDRRVCERTGAMQTTAGFWRYQEVRWEVICIFPTVAESGRSSLVIAVDIVSSKHTFSRRMSSEHERNSICVSLGAARHSLPQRSLAYLAES